MTRIEQQKRKIKILEQKLKDWKSNAEIWKFYYKREQEETHRLHNIIKRLECRKDKLNATGGKNEKT